MLNESLARRYSIALYASAKAKGEESLQLKELRIVQGVLAENPALRRALIAPTISRPVKRKVLQAVFGGQVGQRTSNFLYVLVDKGREIYLDDIVESYKREFCAEKGIIEVLAESASTLEESLQAEITQQLGRLTGKKVKMEVVVRPELIGGLVLKYSGYLFDGSVRRHLDNIHDLMAPSSI